MCEAAGKATVCVERGGRLSAWMTTRPTLFTHIARRETLDAIATDLFSVVASGAVKIPVHARAKLSEAAEVHRKLEGRGTTGATVMLP